MTVHHKSNFPTDEETTQQAGLPYHLVGTPVWLYAGEEDDKGEPKLSAGVIICRFRPLVAALDYYVIRLDNPEWPIFETRDALMLTLNPAEPPLFKAMRPGMHGGVPQRAMIGISQWVHVPGSTEGNNS